MNTPNQLERTQHVDSTFAVLCPRCGLEICYFILGVKSPYCGGCGWNLNLVSEPWLTNYPGYLAIFAMPPLLTLCTLYLWASWRITLLTLGIAGVLAVAADFARRRNLQRITDLVTEISTKPGADLSSKAPVTPPERVLAYEIFLRQCPRQLRDTNTNPFAIWLTNIIFALLLFLPAHPLFSVAYRLNNFQGPALYIFECAVILGLWFFFWNIFRQRPPTQVQLTGEICMARIVPGKTERGKATYEFRTASGNLLQVERTSMLGMLYPGTYIPLFYDKDNPQICFGACDLGYELVLPAELRFDKPSTNI